MNEEIEFDPAARQLCPDGACVGLIGADGRCGECGRAGGTASARGSSGPAAQADELASAGESLGADGADGTDGFDAGRKLCDDGACVGVVGPDGRCQTCGRVSGS
jgi:hypothetical protein